MNDEIATAMPTSPKITDIKWGQVSIDELHKEYKDAKLWPGGGRAWDWNETGTRHSPGVQVDDVQELVENGAEILILSKGYFSRLKVKDETLQWLEDKGVEVEILETGKAAKRYNELAEQGKAVGGLFHSTC
jgi:hypothetical protein